VYREVCIFYFNFGNVFGSLSGPKKGGGCEPPIVKFSIHYCLRLHCCVVCRC